MSDINVQSFQGKVNISNNLKVGSGHLFVDTLNNQVGLNTNTPLANLHVNGNTYVNTDLRVGSKLLVDSGASDSNVLVVTGGNIKADFLYGDGSNITNITSSQWTTVNTNELYYNAGNVGIGNQNPAATLDVTGNTYVSSDFRVGSKLLVDSGASDSNVLVVTGGNIKADFLYGDGSNITNITSSQWTTVNTNELYYNAGNVGIGNQNPSTTLDVTGTSSFSDDLAVGTDKLFVDVSAGSVGVGTATPAYTLDIVGDINFTGNLTQNGTEFEGGGGAWTAGTGSAIYYTAGNVGIANTNPQHTLSIGSNLYVEDAGSNVLVVVGNVSANTITLGEIGIVPSYGLDDVVSESNTTTKTVHLSNVTTGVITTSNAVIGGELAISGNVAVDTDTLFVDSVNDRVGVGTTTPGSALDVVGDVNIVSNVNMLHTANTASIKLNSNVVTEFPRSKKLVKYPRVVLTANGLNQGYTVSGSDDYSSGLTFYGAFTPPTTLSTPSGAWLTPTSGTVGYSTSTGEYLLSAQLHSASLTGEYVQIVLPERINPVYFTVQPRPESANNNQGLLSCINEGEIWASDDSGTTWTPVGTIQNFTPTGLYQEYIVDNFNAPGYYDTFALIIHKNNGQDFAGVGEWKIFGTPEYDPDAHGTDVVVKSLPNVPNTDWLEVYYDGQDYTSTPATVTDNSGNNLTGTLNGGVGFDTGYKAFTFDGVDDYISNIHSGYTSSNTYTASVWFNRTAGNKGALFQYGIDSSTTPIAIGIIQNASPSDRIISYISGSARAMTELNPSYSSLNEWNHAASVYSPKGVTLYINGIMVANNTEVNPAWNNSITIPTSPHLTIGAQGDTTSTGIISNTYFTGSIANFRLFKRVLTSDEIWQLYAYQKEYFGRGDLGMTLKAGRLGIGTSEPRAALDVRGGFQCGNFPLQFFVVNGEFPATGTTQTVTNLPQGLKDRIRHIVLIQGLTVNTDGDITNWIRHGSTTWEVDISVDVSVPHIFLSGFDATNANIQSKAWRIFVVTT
jgi:hypothetical protein